MSRLKIFVSAYACEPELGSEIGVGWHWVLEMSKYFELWVLTRKSNQTNIEHYIASHPEHRNIHFLYFDLPKWARFWKKGLRGVRTYYNIWQYMTRHIVEKTMKDNDIDIFHHLTYGNVVWNVSNYGQKQFFIWGPVGGLEYIDKEYSCHYSLKSRIIEAVRRNTVKITGISSGFRRRCKNADLILCKTAITRNSIPQEYADKTVQFTDVAADPVLETPVPKSDKNTDPTTRFITVGRLDAWRGFDLILEALSQAIKMSTDIHLTIVGEGADRKRLAAMIEKYDLRQYVTMTGKVAIGDYKQLMSKADVVINAALKEGAVTVSFDCLSMGKPLICIDTTGYTRYFSDDYAIVIPKSGRSEVINNLKEAMLRLTDPQTRATFSAIARQKAAEFSWEQHGRKIRDVIEASYKRYLSRK